MYDVIALGELLVDLAERSKDEAGYPTLAANPGGAPGNRQSDSPMDPSGFSPPVRGGAGYGNLQRKINESGEVPRRE